MQVRDIMTAEIECVSASDNLKTAAQKMKKLNVGVLPVLEGNKPAGILTDRDIVVRAIAEGKDLFNTTVKDIMSQDVFTCNPSEDAMYAADLMKQKKVRRLLVRDEQNKVVGILSFGDLIVKLGGSKSCEVIQRISEPAEPNL